MENGSDNYLKTDLMNVILREKKVVFHRVIHIDFQLDKIYLYLHCKADYSSSHKKKTWFSKVLRNRHFQ